MTTYELKPAGHDAPDIVKRTYSKPDRKLQLRFEEWLGNDSLEKNDYRLDKSFQAAEHAVSKLEVNVDEAHGLLIEYQDHPKIVNAGLFLSAIYNQQPNNAIVYDVETTIPINCIGYRLAERKTLTLNAQSGHSTGWSSSGIIIVNAQSGDWTGYKSSGIVITNAQSGDDTGWQSSGIVITNAQSGDGMGLASSGIIITNAPSGDFTGGGVSGILIVNAQSGNYTGGGSSGVLLARTKPEHIGENNARVLLPEDIKANKQLDEYLAQLCDVTKAIRTVDDIAAFREQYGPNPQKGIEEDIKSLLKGRLFETIKKWFGGAR